MAGEVIVYQRFWMRRDTAANWTSANPILASGEWGVETDNAGATPRKYKMGDGITAWNSLPYAGTFDLAAAIHAATGKTTPVDADEFGIVDTAASNALKKLTWANVKATMWAAWGALIAAGTGKTTPVNADSFAICDSAASNATKQLTMTNLKAFLKTYFDTLYTGGSGQAAIQFKDEGSNVGSSGAITSVDFVGSGISAAVVGTALTVTASGGGSGYVLGGNVSWTTTPVTTTATTIPLDGTIPQNTEGASWAAMSNTYVVTSAASKLRGLLTIPLWTPDRTLGLIVAIFRDSGASAIAATVVTSQATAGFAHQLVLPFLIPSSATGSTTFSVRIGVTVGTAYLLTYATGSYLGTSTMATFSVEELA